MAQLDKLDIKILDILQQDTTIAVKDIAEKIGLTTTPTYERIKKMEQDGVIKDYVALIDPAKAGVGLLVYCNIVLKEQSKEALLSFEKAVSDVPEVIEVMSMSGSYDYMLKIAAKDVNTYNDFLFNVILNIPYIGQYHSSFVLKELKKTTAYQISC